MRAFEGFPQRAQGGFHIVPHRGLLALFHRSFEYREFCDHRGFQSVGLSGAMVRWAPFDTTASRPLREGLSVWASRSLREGLSGLAPFDTTASRSLREGLKVMGLVAVVSRLGV